ncbi:amidohydrolase [Puniceicoccales bacterium CK1056]|uniref:Amidohydrolase n=1 Tax=Oceanipulchritudo coccoides TaxID=2706888 RepID=A0A6B2M4U8_9BACT|nr:amidohydrolase [Oceanipulchritudo coccoides]
MDTIAAEINAIVDEVRALRHDLHRHPELAYEEHETVARVKAFMGSLTGAEIQTGIGGTGMTVLFGKEIEGPCVALRADMDALAMEEESGVEWSSTVPGKMHACGHDGHTAMLAGAARILSRHVDSLQGPVKLIFQPAEEGGAGGLAMCEAGVLKDPAVSAIFGLHNNLPDPSMKIGSLAYTSGAAMAGTGTFDIEVLSSGGHAAFPHRCVDPVYVGACIVEQLHGIVSRMIDPIKSAVITVTRFEAGSAYNIIPSKAVLRGTFRALDRTILEMLQETITKRATEVARAHGAEVRIRCELGYPVLVNDAKAEDTFRRVLAELGQADRMVEVQPNMGGEDFAYFARQVPGFFYFLPACPVDQDSVHGCHHPSFDFNDDLLADGIRLHVETALQFARLWKT